VQGHVRKEAAETLAAKGGTFVGQLHSLYARKIEVDLRKDLPKDRQGRGWHPMPWSRVSAINQVHSHEQIHLLFMDFEEFFANPSSLPLHRVIQFTSNQIVNRLT